MNQDLVSPGWTLILLVASSVVGVLKTPVRWAEVDFTFFEVVKYLVLLTLMLKLIIFFDFI